MIVKTELVKRIKDYFDLNIYETKVWMALLSRGLASASEIAELSGVPRSRTYDVLESLEKRGFAIVKLGKPIKYIAVKPVEVLEKMKIKVIDSAEEKVKTLSGLKDTSEYNEILQLYKSGISPIKPHDITGSLKGRSNVLAKLRDLLENAEKEVTICTSVDDFEDKSRVLAPTIEKLNRKNVKVRVALSGDAERIKKLNSKLDLKARQIETSGRFFMADRKEALCMITPENSDDEIAVWLNSSFFTESVSGLVELSFRNGNGKD